MILGIIWIITVVFIFTSDYVTTRIVLLFTVVGGLGRLLLCVLLLAKERRTKVIEIFEV